MKIRLFSTALGVISLIPATLAGAAQSGNVEEFVVTGKQKALYKTDFNSTAMRMETSQLETPGQVSVISEQLINEQMANTLGEVLKNDASVSAQGTSRNRERFALRGFNLSSSSGFLRNGQQHWSHYRQPVELLERVEILKGPAGLLYGQSAPGGLVNMVTKKPTAEAQFSVTQELGSNNLSRTIIDASGALDDAERLRARAIVAKQTGDSWRSYTDGSKPETDRFVGGLFVDYDLTDNTTVSFHYDRTVDDSGVDSGAYIVNGKPVLGDKHIWDAQWSNIKNEVENVGVDLNWAINDTWNLKTGYNHQDFVRRDVESFSRPTTYNPATGTFDYRGYDRHDNWQFDTAYVDLTGTFEALGVEHQTLIGANWLGYYYKRQLQSLTGFTGTVGQPLVKPANLNYRNNAAGAPSERDSYGIYMQDLITFNDQWQVLAGVRLDREETDTLNQNNVLPKAALIFHPAENASIYLSYSESFEPQGTVNNPLDVNDGKDLDPVEGILYELGTKWNLFDDRLYVSGAIFRIIQENKVLTESFALTPAGHDQATKQIGEQTHDGAELSIVGHVTDKLSLYGSVTYLDAELKDPTNATLDGNRPADVAKLSASVWSSYDLSDSTAVNLGAVYVGDRYGDSNNTYKKDSYTRVDAGLSHTLHYSQDMDITLRFNVQNLLDADFYEGGDQDNTVIGEERNYIASVTFAF